MSFRHAGLTCFLAFFSSQLNDRSLSFSVMARITRQGFPPAMTLDGISFVTTLPASDDTVVSYGHARRDGNSSADPYVIPDRNRPCVFEPFVSSLDIGGVTCRIEAHVGGDEHVVAYGDGSLVEHNAIVVGKEIFAQVNVMPIVAKERAIC